MAAPITPVVPFEDPDQHEILTPDITTPYNIAWYLDTTVDQIPPDSVGWMVTAGWVTTNITYDTTTKPPTPYYEMKKKVLQNELILQSLLGEYTWAMNTAKANNEVRYNDIVRDWTQTLTSSQLQFDEQVSAQNTHASLYLSDLTSYMDAVNVLIEDNQSSLVADAAVATTALTAMDTKLSDLETNVGTSTTTIEGLLTDQAGYLSTFLAAFVAKRAELDTNYATHLAKIELLLQDVDADLSTFEGSQATQLAALSAAYTAHESTLGTLLSTAGTYLSGIATDITDVLTDIASDYIDVETEISALLVTGDTKLAAHVSDYDSVLAQLESDYILHEAVATAFLIDLGMTESARISAKFAASLSTQLQQAVDRGLYSSQFAIDLTARNTRDHNEEIVALNDRLNREKVENQHHLYSQQVTMRQGTMAGKSRMHGLQQELLRYQASQIVGLHGLQQSLRDRTMAGKQALYAIRDANTRLNLEVKNQLYSEGAAMRRVLIDEAARLQQLSQTITQFNTGQRDRLLEQIQTIVTQHTAGLDRQHTAEQSVSGAAVSERNILLQQLQDAVKGVVTGKDRYAAMTMQNASTMAEHRHRMVVERMNETVMRRDGGQKKHDEDMQLMAYQLDERNKLLIGLYGFVERREDVGPSLEDLSKLATSLADSSGGWISP